MWQGGKTMKVELFPFQKIALQRLRMSVATALGNYWNTHTPQIVSYTAPTGAGKTIIMSALIESIFYGDERYPDQSDAIFVWLSDSPQLNEQSKNKIDLKADKIRLDQCVTISDESFDRKILDDGHIYFINTQKLSKSSNLTKHGDSRTYTIWETLANTVYEKSDRLYFIIDEAHRGAQKNSELAKATTIMQKFLKGSPADRLPQMPVVIGMTATSARFHRLAQGIQSTTHFVETTPDEVRASGLLKDRIAIKFPDAIGNDMAVLQAAADEWKDKCVHWFQYCSEQHYAHVNPIFLIQVENGTAHNISATDLDECVRIVEERVGEQFIEGQVVHAFGETNAAIALNGLKVPYVAPSDISDNRRIKMVFFKETLSTGWDCPRAETMMSFRRATDYTYIAQLLGRMIRTPTQQHINVDETLNEVHLFLPRFDEDTVYKVVDALKGAEGANIPTEIEAEMMGTSHYDTLSLRPTYSTPARNRVGARISREIEAGQMSLFDTPAAVQPNTGYTVVGQRPDATQSTENRTVSDLPLDSSSAQNVSDAPADEHASQVPTNPPSGNEAAKSAFDREAVVKAINDAGLLTYHVRKTVITDYLRSMLALSRFLTQTRIDLDAKETIFSEVTEKIHSHIQSLKASGEYDDLSTQVMQFKLKSQLFDVFGRIIDDYGVQDIFSTTDTDIDRQFRLAETRLGNEGIGMEYCRRYYEENDPVTNKIDVIIFVANKDCMDDLHEYAKIKFHDLNDANRRKTVTLPSRFRRMYDNIVSDGDIVSEHNFRLPETICVPHEQEGKVYANHLFVDDSGTAVINLNNWEEKTIAEEEKQDDFVCWLRNPSRGSWALCIPYELDGVKKPTYPDFLIIRRYDSEYIVDVLEPHDPSRVDNLGKAQGLAEYARQNPGVGRIQLIRMKRDSLGKERPYRLDLSKSLIRNKVLHCSTNDELNHIFDSDGFFI